jgi:hypothetical protein
METDLRWKQPHPSPSDVPSLQERMYKARQRLQGYTSHPDYAAFTRDGYLLKDLDALTESQIIAILQMASGEPELGIPRAIRWQLRNTSHTAQDPQYEAHVDNAVGPIIKVCVCVCV